MSFQSIISVSLLPLIIDWIKWIIVELGTFFRFSSRYYKNNTEFSIKLTNKAGYTATPVACGWAGAVLEKVTRAFGQEQ